MLDHYSTHFWLSVVAVVTVDSVCVCVCVRSDMKMSNRLQSMEQSVSNLSHVIQSLNTSLQHAQGRALTQIYPVYVCVCVCVLILSIQKVISQVYVLYWPVQIWPL